MPTPPTKRPRLSFSSSSNNQQQRQQNQQQPVLKNSIATATKSNNNNSCHIPQTPTPSAKVPNQEENVKEQEEEDSFTDVNHDLDDLDTETKLAILSSLFPLLTQEDLLEVLITSDGSLDVAKGVLGRRFENSSGLRLGMRGQENSVDGREKYPMLKRKCVSSTTQASLMSYLGMSSATTTSTSTGTDTAGVGAGTAITTNPSMPKPQKGKPLLLYSPEHVAALTPCVLVTKFLPSEMANELLLELLKQAETFPKKGSEATRFRLFEREVWSRHTSGFYVRGGGDGNVEEEEENTQVWYTYSGLKEGKMRTFTEKMKVVTEMVERKVREVIEERWERELKESGNETSEGVLHATGRRKYESPYPWSTNAAIVNCYDGGGETVGWHADQVTYLGPMATIASVSLGVGREFGLKKEGSGQDESSGGGIVKVWLPHNSLLIMEAGTQEEWKHCIYPTQAITTHPLSHSKRINITYRYYRPSLAPKYTPRCKCTPAPLPGVLRTVMDRTSGNYKRYFWTCQGGYQGKGEGGEGCGWFEWAEWDEDGEVKGWRGRKESESGVEKRRNA